MISNVRPEWWWVIIISHWNFFCFILRSFWHKQDYLCRRYVCTGAHLHRSASLNVSITGWKCGWVYKQVSSLWSVLLMRHPWLGTGTAGVIREALCSGNQNPITRKAIIEMFIPIFSEVGAKNRRPWWSTGSPTWMTWLRVSQQYLISLGLHLFYWSNDLKSLVGLHQM